MIVTFKRTWFAPMQVGPANDRRSISGGRFRKGTHEVPEELRPYLPKDAKVISDPAKVVEEEKGDLNPDLTYFDLDRASGEAERVMEDEAENEQARQAEIREKRRQGLEKARAAKAAKKEKAD